MNDEDNKEILSEDMQNVEEITQNDETQFTDESPMSSESQNINQKNTKNLKNNIIKNNNNSNNKLKRNFGKQNEKNNFDGAANKNQTRLSQVVNAGKNKLLNQNNLQNNKLESKQKTKQEVVKSTIKNYIKKNPMLVLYMFAGIFIFFLLILIIIMLIVLFSDDNSNVDLTGYYIDPTYDYTKVQLIVNNGYYEEIIAIEDFIIGATYATFYDKNVSKEVYKAYMVTIKNDLLTYGKYDIKNKDYGLNIANQIPYCDIYNGCKKIVNNGTNVFIKKDYNGEVASEVIEINSASNKVISNILDAYEETKYEILAPNTLNSALENYFQLSLNNNISLKFSKNYIDKWLTKNKTKYEEIVLQEEAFANNYQIYDIRNYVSYNISANVSYWWPISSAQPDSPDTESPISTTVTSHFNMVSKNFGIKIKAINFQDILQPIAIADGFAGSCVYEDYGYTFTIYHTQNDIETGLSSEYHNLMNCPAETGSKIEQGALLSFVDENINELDFRIKIEGLYVNPEEYIDINNPRPASEISIAYSEGISNKQTVCLTLKKSNFSDNAVSALMANINAESSFRPEVKGDGGDSFGLCQWNKSRYQNLKNYCGNAYTTIECQLNYLMYELKTGYEDVYLVLLSNSSAYDMAYKFCSSFEKPAAVDIKSDQRGRSASDIFLPYVQNGCQ